jgi:hypothetical protein
MKRLVIVVALLIVGLFLLKGEPKGESINAENIEAELEQTVIDRLSDRIASLRLGAELSLDIHD